MMLFKSLAVLASGLFSNVALAAPNPDAEMALRSAVVIPKTCTATYFTTYFVETVLRTVTTVATIPHQCFTYLEAVPQSNNAFCGTFNPTTCGLAPQCILLQPVTVPCHDPCCPTTTTIKTPGACVSCQTGCRTMTTVVTATNCSPTPTKY